MSDNFQRRSHASTAGDSLVEPSASRGPMQPRTTQKLPRELSGMIHWLTINNHPSNPQQPIHSLRLAPGRHVRRPISMSFELYFADFMATETPIGGYTTLPGKGKSGNAPSEISSKKGSVHTPIFTSFGGATWWITVQFCQL